MDTQDQQPSPVKLEYATPISKQPIREKAASTAVANHLTAGVAVGIFLCVLAEIVLIDDGGPSAGVCLMLSPFALLFAWLTSVSGASHDRKLTAPVRVLQAAFIVGVALPTLNLVAGALLDRIHLSDSQVRIISICFLALYLVGPFLAGFCLIRYCVLPNHLPNQRDAQ